MLTPNNLYSNIDEICPSWVRFHFRQNMQNLAGRNINSTTTSLIFVQPLNNVINSSYLRPNFFALCLAVGEKVVAILLYRTLFVSILTRVYILWKKWSRLLKCIYKTKHRRKHKFIGFIDVDEYTGWSFYHCSSLPGVLQLLVGREAIYVRWKLKEDSGCNALVLFLMVHLDRKLR